MEVRYGLLSYVDDHVWAPMRQLINTVTEVVESENPFQIIEEQLMDLIIECDKKQVPTEELKEQFLSLLTDFPDPNRRIKKDLICILNLNYLEIEYPNPVIEEVEQTESVNKCFMVRCNPQIPASAYSLTHRTADNPNDITHIQMNRGDFLNFTKSTNSTTDLERIMTMPLSYYTNVININNDLPADTPLPPHLLPPTRSLPSSNPFVCSFSQTQQRKL